MVRRAGSSRSTPKSTDPAHCEPAARREDRRTRTHGHSAASTAQPPGQEAGARAPLATSKACGRPATTIRWTPMLLRRDAERPHLQSGRRRRDVEVVSGGNRSTTVAHALLTTGAQAVNRAAKSSRSALAHRDQEEMIEPQSVQRWTPQLLALASQHPHCSSSGTPAERWIEATITLMTPARPSVGRLVASLLLAACVAACDDDSSAPPASSPGTKPAAATTDPDRRRPTRWSRRATRHRRPRRPQRRRRSPTPSRTCSPR